MGYEIIFPVKNSITPQSFLFPDISLQSVIQFQNVEALRDGTTRRYLASKR